MLRFILPVFCGLIASPCLGEEDIYSDFDPERLVIGVTVAAKSEIDEEKFKALFEGKPPVLPSTGLLVLKVLERSPADGNILPLDLIVSVNRKATRTTDDFRKAVEGASGLEDLEFRVMRLEKDGRGQMRWKMAPVVKLRPASAHAVLMGHIAAQEDPIEETTIYSHRGSPDRTGIELFYIVGKGGELTPLRARFRYTGRDWLFIERVIVKAGEEKFEISQGFFDVSRDVRSGGVTEWFYIVVDPEHIPMMEAIARNRGATMRLVGEDYYDDVRIDADMADRIYRMLLAYRLSQERRVLE